MQDYDSLIKCVGLLNIWGWTAFVIILSVLRPIVLFLSVLHYFEYFALKSTIAVELAECWWLIVEKRRSRLEQILSCSS